MIKKMKEKRTLTTLLLAGMMIGAALFAFVGCAGSAAAGATTVATQPKPQAEGAESTVQEGEFVLIENPADFSTVPGCESLDILTVMVFELDGALLYLDMEMNGDVLTTLSPIASEITLWFMIKNTEINIVLHIRWQGYTDQGVIVVYDAPPDTTADADGNTLKIAVPYKSLPGIHVGSVLSK